MILPGVGSHTGINKFSLQLKTNIIVYNESKKFS